MSIYGKKVVAVLDTQSTFGVRIKELVDDVAQLKRREGTDPGIPLVNAFNDEGAAAQGVPIGGFYRTDNNVKVRIE